MASQTNIEWTEKVWNPVTGCTKISPGCANCYAERMAKRLRGRCGYPKDDPFAVTKRVKKLSHPIKTKPPTVFFVNSMGDLFHEDVTDKFIHCVFNVMRYCTRHTFQVLTKRPERMAELLTRNNWNIEKQKPLPNVWIGVSVENQECAEKRIPLLLKTPAAVRFVSCEPLLGAVDLSGWMFTDREGNAISSPIHWVIAGGESGPGARPMHPDWVRSLRDQCQNACVPFFFKQWGAWMPMFDRPLEDEPKGNVRIVNLEGGHGLHGAGAMWTRHVTKSRSGRLLDGRTWDEKPMRSVD